MFSKRCLPLLLFVFVTIFSCKKEATVINVPDTKAFEARKLMVQQKWDFDLFTHQETIGTSTTYDSIVGVIGDYFEFSSNNELFAFWDGLADTTTYELLDLNTLNYSGAAYTIETLTATNFVFSINRSTDSTQEKDQISLSR